MRGGVEGGEGGAEKGNKNILAAGGSGGRGRGLRKHGGSIERAVSEHGGG